ncbi:flagellar basal body-associated FliL family protein [Shimia sp. SDUM112013]|uniref:flagellar basal body-associated FliL family protein n=1 Tax=Shimia sp. SDUM112013 TaxID=3136160 RepID=UPI0032F0599C
MTATSENVQDPQPRAPQKWLLLSLLLTVVGGGGMFYAGYSGLLFKTDSEERKSVGQDEPEPLPEVSFIPLDPIIVSLGPNASSQHLRFRAQLEIQPEYQSDVEYFLPRIIDVLNNYLRALEASDLEAPGALMVLRAQMLRRIEVVVGPGRVNDLLVMEFVLN